MKFRQPIMMLSCVILCNPCAIMNLGTSLVQSKIISCYYIFFTCSALYYYYFNPTSLLPSVTDDENEQVWNRRWSPAKENADTAVTTGLTTPALMMIAGSVVMLALALKWMVESIFLTSMLSTECENVIKDLRKANRLQKKLKRAVEIEVPEMKKQLVVLECDISRYASLQKFHSD